MAVNLSGRQIVQSDLVTIVASVLNDSSLDPSTLVLEITESVVMKDAQAAIVVLESLKALGVRLSIDDFGTGYSSLSYLQKFPVDILKIDRSFVDGIERRSRGLRHRCSNHRPRSLVETGDSGRRSRDGRAARSAHLNEMHEGAGLLLCSPRSGSGRRCATEKQPQRSAHSGRSLRRRIHQPAGGLDRRRHFLVRRRLVIVLAEVRFLTLGRVVERSDEYG